MMQKRRRTSDDDTRVAPPCLRVAPRTVMRVAPRTVISQSSIIQRGNCSFVQIEGVLEEAANATTNEKYRYDDN